MQLPLDLCRAGLQELAPLLSVPTVRSLLKCHEDFVVQLVESGWVRFAFNIANSGAATRDLRIYHHSLQDYCAGQHLLPNYYTQDESTLWPQVLKDLIAPPLRASEAQPSTHLTARHLATRWVCSSTHIYDLIAAHCLEPISRDWKRGPNGSATILPASAEAFLRARRVGANNQ